MTMQQAHIPSVSVLMAVYNGERYLRKAIDSILGQTFRDFEFLIIDDGSTDSSREIILSYSDPRIRLIDNDDNIGLTKSLNRGLSLAKGEYIARQDADDISLPTRLENQVAFLDVNSEVALLGTQALYIDESGRYLRIDPTMRKATSQLAIKWQLLFDSAFIHTSVMFKRSVVWNLLGGYNPCFIRNQDMDLWMRIASKYEVANLTEIFVESRCSKQSISQNYTVNDVQRVRDSLVIMLTEKLGVDKKIASEWLSFWHQVTNSSLNLTQSGYDNTPYNFNQIVNAFERCYPAAVFDKEYRVCLTSVYVRVVLYLATCRKAVVLQWYTQLLLVNKAIAVSLIPKVFVLMFIGNQAKTLFRMLRLTFGKG